MENLTQQRIDEQPKYKIGMVVNIEIETKHEPTGKVFKNTIQGYIGSISADSSETDYEYVYGIFESIPKPYVNGGAKIGMVNQKDIQLAFEQV